jgi:hypothetical protein
MASTLAHQTMLGLFWQIAVQKVQWLRQPNTMRGPSNMPSGSV